MKFTLSLIIAIIALSSFIHSYPVKKSPLFFSYPDTLPKVQLPPGANPEDPDWKGIDLEPKEPVKALSVSEEQKLFLLPPGYTIEPVLTEPQIQQPGAISFDANGRMYVLELRTYMLDADSKGELAPTSRISRWEDKNNDGVYETGTTFVDNLVFPRFVLPYGKDCILTMESDADNVYKYTDTNGDGISDKKEFFTNKYGRSGNVEHQQAFMFYGMDNWLYSTVNAFRVRETPNGVIREKTGANRAQWGVTQDDNGKLWFQGGASGLPSYFQFPIHYGNFEVKGEFADGFDIPWGAPVKLADMQGGMDEVRQPDGSLNRVTGAAGNDVYRGDKWPANMKGQYFYGEPVARIVRQINAKVSEGLTTLHNVYQDQKSEFLRSTDPLFRPVDMTTAPDGTMYITDMYHGIIQEGQWTQRGSYLRTKIEQYQMDKIIGLGRIWRIRYNGIERNKKQPRMYSDKSSTLVNYLSHPNGWWRDAAQQELVQRKDKSVVPALTKLMLLSKSIETRIHSIWTLEGLESLKPDDIKKLYNHPSDRIRIQALRASESIIKTGDKSFDDDIKRLFSDIHQDVVIQAMLTAKQMKIPGYEAAIKSLMDKSSSAGVKLVGGQILSPPRPRNAGPFGAPELSAKQKEIVENGATIYNELCSQCHAINGMGAPGGPGRLMAPALAGSLRMQSHPEYAIKAVLHGLEGPVDGKSYTANVMTSMKDQSDQWIADVISYIRSGLSNDASIVYPEQVAKIRAATKDVKKAYTFDQLLKESATEFPSDKIIASASTVASTRIGGNVSAKPVFNYEGWSSGGKQEAGMWFQLEFPLEVTVSEIHFTSPQNIRRGWRPAPRVEGQQPAPPPMVQAHPRDLKIEASYDGNTWTKLMDYKGTANENVISLEKAPAKFIRMTLNTSLPAEPDEIPWSMRSMKVYVKN